MKRLVLCLMLSLAAPLHAAETQWWVQGTPGDHLKSEADGVLVRADGSLTLGDAVRSWPADPLRTIWALAVLADGSVAVAGDSGRIDRWTAANGVRPWVRVADGQVLSLAVDGDGVVAGTGPRGLFYRISGRGDTTRLAATGERYVWGIAPAGPGAWWLATGTRGRLMRWNGGGAQVVWSSGEGNLTALVADGSRGVVTGGDRQGRIVHVAPDGRARTRWDGPEEEVRALVRDPDGTLWAALLTSSAVSGMGEDGDSPSPQRTSSGARSVVHRLGADGMTSAWWTAPQSLVFALLRSGDRLLAGTGNRAGVHEVERANATHVRLAPPQGQVTALANLRGGGILAATSNPAALWVLGPAAATAGTITSASVDLRRPARLGRLEWDGRGSVQFEVRAGYSETPDSTWEGWVALDADQRPTRPVFGRYVQWRASLEGRETRVDAVRFASREPNLPPRVEEITVAPQAQSIRDGGLGPRSESVTQNLPGGQKVEYSVVLSANRNLRDLPSWARGLRTLQWRASDANADPLTFRVHIRDADETGQWVEIGKDLEASLLTWDTTTLPDGRYRVRVTASDARSNALGEELTTEAVSEVFTVDNTPPTLPTLSAQVRAGVVEVSGVAEDVGSPIWRMELSVNDGAWRLIAPEDGVLDRRREPIRATLRDLAPGEHLVSVRVVDMAGNSAVRGVRVRVTR